MMMYYYGLSYLAVVVVQISSTFTSSNISDVLINVVVNYNAVT